MVCSISGLRGNSTWGHSVRWWLAIRLAGCPWGHLPLALAAGALGGALWGAIPGVLKARFGAHEVINTIMMNYIA